MATGRELTAQAIADLVGGEVRGAPDRTVRRVRSLSAGGPDAVAIYAHRHYAADLAASRAGLVLAPPDLVGDPGPADRIAVADPAVAILAVIAALHPEAVPPDGIAATARVGTGTVVGTGSSVGEYAVIGARVHIGAHTRIASHVVIGDDVVVGDGVVLEPRVVIYGGATLGNRVRCKAGAVIGGRGFGYVQTDRGHMPIPHVGGCILEDDVEVGSSSCIDRGSLDDTIIGRGTKIDNLVHVAHNVHTGPDCLLMAGAGVAGSTRLGARVVLAGQSGCVDHIVLGDDVRVAAKAGATGDIAAGTTVSGFPARPHREVLRATAALYALAPHARALAALVDGHDA